MTPWTKRFLLLACGLVAAEATGRADDPPRVVGYFAEWAVYQRKYNVADIPAGKLTHVNYAFAKVQNGECTLYDAYAAIDKFHPGDDWNPGTLRGNFRELQRLKAKHKHLKTLISVGGWTLSGPFSDVALTEESRAKFAKSCVGFIRRYGFDGVDIDWEYPVGGGLESNKTRPEDKGNYTKLLAELRRQLDAEKAGYLLTIAAPAGPKTSANIELAEVAKLCDWLNLMAYDFHGSWSKTTNHHAALHANPNDPTADETVRTQWNVSAAVKNTLAAGVPAGKIVLGVPFYGRGWIGANDAGHGLFQPHSGRQPPGTWEAANWDYKDIAANYVGKKAARHWDAAAKAPWLYDPKSGLFITYDDEESIGSKAAFAAGRKLGGMMAWELSGDTKEHSLLDAIRKGWKGGP
jgi:chitinase